MLLHNCVGFHELLIAQYVFKDEPQLLEGLRIQEVLEASHILYNRLGSHLHSAVEILGLFIETDGFGWVWQFVCHLADSLNILQNLFNIVIALSSLVFVLLRFLLFGFI